MQVKHLEIKQEGGNGQSRQLYLAKNNNTGKIIRLGGKEVKYLLKLLDETEAGPMLGVEECKDLSEEQQEIMKEKFMEWYFLNDITPKDEKSHEFSKIKLVDFKVDKLISRIFPIYKQLFSKVGLVVFFICLAVNVGIIIYSFSIVDASDIEAVSLKFSAMDIVIIIILLFLSIAAHELAHGVVCMKYGGKVRKMGLVLFYFLPCFYCDVTDIYMIDEKKNRAYVALAGVYTNLFIGAFLLMITQILGFFDIVLFPVIYFSVTTIAVALYNLIPFVKLDGYWFVSAVSGVVNLMDKSFLVAYVACFKKEEFKNMQISAGKVVSLMLYFICTILFKPLFWCNNLFIITNVLKLGAVWNILIVGAGILIISTDLVKTCIHYKKLISGDYIQSLGFI